MKFSSYLPDYDKLESSKFRPHPKDKSVRRLQLSVDHVVTGKVGGRNRYGKSALNYNLDFGASAPYSGRMINETKVYAGVQSTEFLAHEYERLRTRTGYSAQHFGTGMFDMRSIMYVLGAAQMGGVSGTTMTRSGEPALYKTLGGGYTTPRTGEITVGPQLYTTRHEFITALMLFGEAGVNSVQLMTDYIPGTEATILQGLALSRYVQRLAFNVLYMCNSTVTYGMHYQAYVSGMLSVCTLNGHSDEGGWVRKMLTMPDYPTPCGVLFCMDRRFGSYPLAEKVSTHEIARNTYAMFLEAMAMLAVADVKAHGKQSLARRGKDERRSVNSYEAILDQLPDVMEAWREIFCDLHGAHRDNCQTYGDYNAYIGLDAEDRHFDNEVIVPWFFVEPSPFITEELGYYKPPAMTGKVTQLPMFRQEKVSHSASVVDPLYGGLAPGATIGIVRSAGDMRMEGFSYLLSPAYHPDNGLASLVIRRSRDGEGPDGAMFFDPEEELMNNQRWILSDCPIVAPFEGYTTAPQQLYYHVSGYGSLTPQEIATGTVSSFFGTFRVGSGGEGLRSRTHRSVPRSIRNEMFNREWNTAEFQYAQTVVVSGPAPAQPDMPLGVDTAVRDGTPTPTALPTPETVTPPDGETEHTGEPAMPSPGSPPEKAKASQPPEPLLSEPGDSTPAKSADLGVKPSAPGTKVQKNESPEESKGSD